MNDRQLTSLKDERGSDWVQLARAPTLPNFPSSNSFCTNTKSERLMLALMWYLDDDLDFLIPHDLYSLFSLTRLVTNVFVKGGLTVITVHWSPLSVLCLADPHKLEEGKANSGLMRILTVFDPN